MTELAGGGQIAQVWGQLLVAFGARARRQLEDAVETAMGKPHSDLRRGPWRREEESALVATVAAAKSVGAAAS